MSRTLFRPRVFRNQPLVGWIERYFSADQAGMFRQLRKILEEPQASIRGCCKCRQHNDGIFERRRLLVIVAGKTRGTNFTVFGLQNKNSPNTTRDRAPRFVAKPTIVGVKECPVKLGGEACHGGTKMITRLNYRGIG